MDEYNGVIIGRTMAGHDVQLIRDVQISVSIQQRYLMALGKL
jgi:hypothetical protein